SQKVTLFADGTAIGQAPISTGVPGHPTPMGIFSVISKDRYHHSNLYSNAPMPFMQRLTWSGAALHQGPLPGYPASHGCIRLTQEFADLLWKTTKLGARVIVTKPDVTPVPIENAHLFVPAPPALAQVADASPASAIGTAKAAETVAKADAPAFTGSVTAMLMPHGAGPISVFISRKDRRLYVRQATHPLFDMPVTIKDSDAPIGTHVYTAMALKDDGSAFRWNAITIPSAYPHAVKTAKLEPKGRKHHEVMKSVVVEPPMGSNASEALDRLELPPDALSRIQALITAGSSLIVSDN